MIRVVLALVLVGAVAGPGRAADGDFLVIVHPDSPTRAISRSLLRDIFLKKTVAWGNGDAARPVDLSKRFPARAAFARRVLGKTLAQLKRYWSQQIFSGKGVPPPEVDSEEAVVAFVLARRGAIGYLPAGADPGRARVVAVE